MPGYGHHHHDDHHDVLGKYHPWAWKGEDPAFILASTMHPGKAPESTGPHDNATTATPNPVLTQREACHDIALPIYPWTAPNDPHAEQRTHRRALHAAQREQRSLQVVGQLPFRLVLPPHLVLLHHPPRQLPRALLLPVSPQPGVCLLHMLNMVSGYVKSNFRLFSVLPARSAGVSRHYKLR